MKLFSMIPTQIAGNVKCLSCLIPNTSVNIYYVKLIHIHINLLIHIQQPKESQNTLKTLNMQQFMQMIQQ